MGGFVGKVLEGGCYPGGGRVWGEEVGFGVEDGWGVDV